MRERETDIQTDRPKALSIEVVQNRSPARVAIYTTQTRQRDKEVDRRIEIDRQTQAKIDRETKRQTEG